MARRCRPEDDADTPADVVALDSARMVWFERHIAEGCSTAEALERALAYVPARERAMKRRGYFFGAGGAAWTSWGTPKASPATQDARLSALVECPIEGCTARVQPGRVCSSCHKIERREARRNERATRTREQQTNPEGASTS